MYINNMCCDVYSEETREHRTTTLMVLLMEPQRHSGAASANL